MSLYGYGFDRRRHARAVAWQALLDAATTQDEVVGAVRDFVAQFSPAEIADLPMRCRPRRLVDAGDVNEYAFALAQAHFEADPLESSALQKLSAFLTSASSRLSQLMASDSEAIQRPQ